MPGTKLWTTKEIKILLDNFQQSGVDACVTLLPGRSYDDIRCKAQSMGLKTSKRRHAGGYPRVPPTDGASATISRARSKYVDLS